MGKDIKKKILEKVVKPYAENKFNTVRALVVDYDNKTNQAKIKFQNPTSSGILIMESVPVQLASYEMHSVSLKEGDYVWVSFINGSPLLPRIISLADEAYQFKTREQLKHLKGGCLISSLQHKEPLDEIASLIEEKNEDIIKHFEFKDFDVFEKIKEFKENLGHFGEEDVGITHRNNDSVIKIKKDGTVEIYSTNNQGIKIDPNAFSISILANKQTTIAQEGETSFKKWSIKGSNIDIVSENINVKCDNFTINGVNMLDV